MFKQYFSFRRFFSLDFLNQSFRFLGPLSLSLFNLSLVALLLLLSTNLQAADNSACGRHWEWANPKPQGLSLHDVLWNKSQQQFLAVGNKGAIISSSDGLNWQSHQSNTSKNLNALVYSGGQYVAVGSDGAIVLSPDGQSWQPVASSSSLWFSLQAIAFNGQTYVAGGYNGHFVTSSDGKTWQQGQVNIGKENEDNNINAIIWDHRGQRFLASANGGYILSSPNGRDWQHIGTITIPFGSSPYLNDMVSNGSQFVVVGGQWDEGVNSYVRIIATSSDGVNWQTQAEPNHELYEVIWNGQEYLASSSGMRFMTSSDGINWSENSSGFEDAVYGLGFDGKQYLAVGADGLIGSSQNGRNWQQSTTGYSENQLAVRYLNNQYFALNDNGYYLSMSDDGKKWRRQNLFDSNNQDMAINNAWAALIDMAYANGQYVLLRFDKDDNGSDLTTIASSSNVSHWSINASLENVFLASITSNGSLFVAVGGTQPKVLNNSSGSGYIASGTSKIYTSSDGRNWQEQTASGSGLNRVIWSQDRFIAVGDKGTVLTSVDGLSWQDISLSSQFSLLDVVLANNQILAVGENGLIMSSSNGQQWQKHFSNTSSNLEAIAFHNGQYTIVGGIGWGSTIALTSSDTNNWTQTTIHSSYLNDLVFDNKQQLVAVGDGGNILYSSCFTGVNYQNTKVIIVAGGGDFDDPLWPATNSNANKAYRTLRQRGLNRENIRYFNAQTNQDVDGDGSASNDIFAAPSSSALESAIKDWATPQLNASTPLLLYLIDHGGPKRFYISKPKDAVADVLSSTTLAGWLNQLQEQTGARTTLVYDACNSGSFMQDLRVPSGKNYERINIFSSKAEQVAYFGSLGQISFSSFFWANTSQGYDVRQAFRKSQIAIRSTTQNASSHYQSALLDDNGDGQYDSHEDGVLARNTQLGIDAITAAVFPKILANSTLGNVSLAANQRVDLKAKVDLPNQFIKRVWAVMVPPDSITTGETPVTDLQEIELSYNAQSTNYEGVLHAYQVNKNGQYTLSYYAMDTEGVVSQEPHIDFLSVSGAGQSACETSAAYFDSGSGLLHLGKVKVFNLLGQAQNYSDVGLKLQSAAPISFSLDYVSQPQARALCSSVASEFSAAGVLNIPTIKLFNPDNSSADYKDAVLQFVPPDSFNLQSISQ